MATAEYETSGLENKRREWAWWWKKEIKNKKKWTSRNERKRRKWRRVLKEKSLSIFVLFFFSKKEFGLKKKKESHQFCVDQFLTFSIRGDTEGVGQRKPCKDFKCFWHFIPRQSSFASLQFWKCSKTHSLVKLVGEDGAHFGCFFIRSFMIYLSRFISLSLSLADSSTYRWRQKRQEKNQNTKWK